MNCSAPISCNPTISHLNTLMNCHAIHAISELQYSHILAILLFLTEHVLINCIAIQFFQSCNSSPNYFDELSINQSCNFSLISTLINCNAVIFFQSCKFLTKPQMNCGAVTSLQPYNVPPNYFDEL